MYPDFANAPSRGSFGTPVPQPVTDPGDAPFVTIDINCDWLPYVRGALTQLLLQATWKPGFPGLDITQARAATLISMFEECSLPTPPFVCSYDFALSAAGAPWSPAVRGGLAMPTAHFQTGVGWSTTASLNVGGVQRWQCCTIHWLLGSAAKISIVQYAYTALIKGTGTADPTGDPSGIVLYNGGAVVATHLPDASTLSDGDGIVSADFHGTVADEIWLTLLASVAPSAPPPGQGFIAGVDVTGHSLILPCP